MALLFFRRFTILCLATAFAAAPASPRLLAQSTPPAQDSEPSKYVGVEVCQGCHEDAYSSFTKSPHVETLKNKSAATRGCEGCHGPGAEHVNAGGDPDRIERYAGVKPEIVLARCGHCHEAKISQQHIDAHLSCLTCHSAHHARSQTPLLVKPAQELCRSCHHSTGG